MIFAWWPALLLGALLLAALPVGIILLIIGLARRRRGMWIGGLVTLIVAVVMMGALAASGFLMFFFRAPRVRFSRSTSSVRTSSVRTSTVRTSGADLTGEMARELLGLPAGAEVPEGGTVVESVAVSDSRSGEISYGVLDVPEGFEALLNEHCEKAAWEDVKGPMTFVNRRNPGLGQWSPELLEDPLCYRKKLEPSQGGPREVFICYDQLDRRLYYVREQTNP
ncbi:MAG: hypothetical protein AMJ81_07645 [Phycisphaerae bacterium SM23_33]|nr:MAG: hypothetical protein AMJ81_07645 [Phycisphaerae bacterium SM23_33]